MSEVQQTPEESKLTPAVAEEQKGADAEASADEGPALTMVEDKGKEIVQTLVDSWSKVFTNQVFFNYSEGNIWCYEVEFSTPKKTKPITEGTVKCFFFITDMGDGAHDMEFNFENESLRHKIDKSMRPSMYEVSATEFKLFRAGLTSFSRKNSRSRLYFILALSSS